MPDRHASNSSTDRGGTSLVSSLPQLQQRPGRVPVVLSYGMGVDSTAILLRWLHEPATRDFDLEDLVVVTAMTGDEWVQTGVDVRDHVLPLLRQHGVRFVQAARARRHVTTSGDGVVVLDDSTRPTELYLSGVYRLSDEMTEAGTIPQTGGVRICSVHAKGDVLDPVIARLTGGAPYRHVIGFEANEARRAERDAGYNTTRRTGEYPLLEWGWDRADCEAYIASKTGVAWLKSCCSYCPFSMGSKDGLRRTLERYAAHPREAVEALRMEHVALALNPAQGLVAGRRAVDLCRDAGLVEVLALFEGRLAGEEHAVYEVRRILRARRDDPSRMVNASRSVRTWATGSRDEMRTLLGGLGDVEVGDDGIWRVHDLRRGPMYPTVERFFVVAPSGVLDKEQPQFPTWWDEATVAAAPGASVAPSLAS